MRENNLALIGSVFLALVAAFWMGYMIGVSHVTRADADWCIKAAQETRICEAVRSRNAGKISQ